ncbi:MAG: NAD(P)-dependent oxidoreductase [Desulfobulbaceae bacterium]|nr:MAG: NAD(P)-dependent oxidoreductase [Desulfobulbaceae bacterium]
MSEIILLTGATGFVGRQILKALIASGLRVRLVIRSGNEQEFVGRKGIESIVTTNDLFSEQCEWFSKICTGIDTVIHCAWYVDPTDYQYSTKNIDCLIGSLNFAKGAALSSVSRFIGIGTCFEYDVSAGKLSIHTPIKPATPYASTKAALFFALSHFFPTQKVSFAWCRLFYLFGEGERSDRFIPYLRSKLKCGEVAELTNGYQIRDYLDVSIAARMIVEIALGTQTGPFNICSGHPITIREMAEKIAEEYGRKDLLKFGARQENIFDPLFIVGVKNE